MSLTEPDFDTLGTVASKPVVGAVSVDGGVWEEALDPSIRASLIPFQGLE